MKLSRFLCLAAALIALPAYASDLEVSTALTTPLSTSNANAGAGNIVIDSGASVTIRAANPVVTVDSDNTLSNSGTISNTIRVGGIGVSLTGGGTDAGFTNDGKIIVQSLTGQTKDKDNVGIQVESGGFTGFLNLGSASSIVVNGADSYGINILGPLTGDLTTGGTITVTGNNATGIYVDGAISGAFLNSGILDAVGVQLSTADTTDATGVHFGGAGSASLFTNTGTLKVVSSGGKTGTVIGLLIDSGASLPSFVNSGTLSVAGSVNVNSAAAPIVYGIRDLSGTLLSVDNSGTLAATTSRPKDGTTNAIAADLSYATANESFTNSGTVAGDLLFGSGANTLSVTAGIVDGTVQATGGGTIAASVSGGVFATSDAVLSSLDVGAGGKLIFVLGETARAGGTVSVSGDANFASGAALGLDFNGALPESGTYTLLAAGGTLTVADAATLATPVLPWLYSGVVGQSDNTLQFTFQRKSASALGLTANETAIYEPAMAAASTDSAFGSALLHLSSAAQVQSTLDQLSPEGIDGSAQRVLGSLTNPMTGALAVHLRDTALAPDTSGPGLNWWGQELYSHLHQTVSGRALGYTGGIFGFAFGADGQVAAGNRFGAALTYGIEDLSDRAPHRTKNYGTWVLPSVYSDWREGDVFINVEGGLGYADLWSKRLVKVGTLKRTLSADWRAYLGDAGIAAGLVERWGGLSVVPEIGVDGSFLHETGYRNTNGNGMNLAVDSHNATNARGFAGITFRDDIDLGNGDMLQPEIRAAFSDDFVRGDTTYSAHFAELAGAKTFAIAGGLPNAAEAMGGAGLSYKTGHWSIHLNYDAERRSGFLEQSGVLAVQDFL